MGDFHRFQEKYQANYKCEQNQFSEMKFRKIKIESERERKVDKRYFKI